MELGKRVFSASYAKAWRRMPCRDGGSEHYPAAIPKQEVKLGCVNPGSFCVGRLYSTNSPLIQLRSMPAWVVPLKLFCKFSIGCSIIVLCHSAKLLRDICGKFSTFLSLMCYSWYISPEGMLSLVVRKKEITPSLWYREIKIPKSRSIPGDYTEHPCRVCFFFLIMWRNGFAFF